MDGEWSLASWKRQLSRREHVAQKPIFCYPFCRDSPYHHRWRLLDCALIKEKPIWTFSFVQRMWYIFKNILTEKVSGLPHNILTKLKPAFLDVTANFGLRPRFCSWAPAMIFRTVLDAVSSEGPKITSMQFQFQLYAHIFPISSESFDDITYCRWWDIQHVYNSMHPQTGEPLASVHQRDSASLIRSLCH